jgi:hypothetical protein
MDSFQIISDHEQDELEFKMKLWYKVPKELTIFLTLDDVSFSEFRTRLPVTATLTSFL